MFCLSAEALTCDYLCSITWHDNTPQNKTIFIVYQYYVYLLVEKMSHVNLPLESVVWLIINIKGILCCVIKVVALELW